MRNSTISLALAASLAMAATLVGQDRGDSGRRGRSADERSDRGGRPDSPFPGGGPGFQFPGGGPPGMFPGGGPPGMFPGGGPPGMFPSGGPPGMFPGGGPPGEGGFFGGRSRGRDGGDSRGGPPGESSRWGGSPEERVSRLVDMLRSMDSNRNGVLEPNEIPEDRRRMMGYIAERMGLRLDRPISLDEARNAAIRRYQGGESGPSQGGSGSSSDKSAKQQEPLVPGFGVEQELPRVPAFGERVEYAMLSTSGAASGRSSSSSIPSSARSDGDRDSRVRFFAEAMLRRSDRNNSGALERDEWEGVRDAEAADRNHDGVITRDELIERLAEFGGRRGEESRREGSGSQGSSGSKSGGSNGRKSYRFLAATERLPEGLPDWFARNDADGDGQVSMAEFATSWSDAEVRKFNRYDLDQDGIITPQEALHPADESAISMAAAGPGGPPPGPGGPTSTSNGTKSEPPKAEGDSKPWWLE